MKNLASSFKDEAKVPHTAATNAQLQKNSVTLIMAPLYYGGPHRGTALGPAAARVAELPEKLQEMGLTIDRLVEIDIPESLCWKEKQHGVPGCVPEILAVSQTIARSVQEAIEQNSIAITIGGDHSVAIGSIAGAAQYWQSQKQHYSLMWFDAHADINTPDTSPSGNVHGMPLAVSLGLGDQDLVNLLNFSPKADAAHTALIGIRDVDTQEKSLIRQTGIKAFSMRDIDYMGMNSVMDACLQDIIQDSQGIHISFDLDALDPAHAPGVSTAADGGMTLRESLLALTLLAKTGKVRSIDFVELNPARDVRNKTARVLVELAKASLGHTIF